MAQEEVFGKTFIGMAHRGVKCPASVVIVVPTHGVFGYAHFGSEVRFLVNADQDLGVGIDVAEIVELIGTFPGIGKK